MTKTSPFSTFIIGLLLGGAVALSRGAYGTWRAGAVYDLQRLAEAGRRAYAGARTRNIGKVPRNVGAAVMTAQKPSSHPARLFAAIAAVESGGDDNAVNTAENAIGQYQIRPAYYRDAIEYMASHREECLRNPRIAEGIMEAYWMRYRCRSDEEKARCHNGGPQGMEKAATLPYWRKVRNALCVSVAK